MTKNYFSHWIITTFFNRLLWLCYGLDSLVLQQSQHRSALVQWRNGSQSSLNYALLLSVLRPALFRSRCSWWPPAGKAWPGCGRGWRSSRSPPPRPAAAACTGSGTCPATSDHFSYFSIKCFSHFLNYVDYFKNSFLINQILCNDVKPIRIPSTSQPNQTFESWNSLFLFGHSSRLIFPWISICRSEGGRQCWVRGQHCTVVQNKLSFFRLAWDQFSLVFIKITKRGKETLLNCICYFDYWVAYSAVEMLQFWPFRAKHDN